MSASGAITQAALVLVDLETDAGITGKAFLFAFMPSMLKPTIQCVEAVSDLIRGDELAPLVIDTKLRKRFTLLDTRGILGQALAGVDMAEWDVLAQSRGLPLARLLGGDVRPVEVSDGYVLIPDEPGIGLEWDEDAVARYAV